MLIPLRGRKRAGTKQQKNTLNYYLKNFASEELAITILDTSGFATTYVVVSVRHPITY